MRKPIEDLFERYERVTNAALAGDLDLRALGELYAESFIGAAPSGVMTGEKGEEFERMMSAGFARYRSIGTRAMQVAGLAVEALDDLHALVRVRWRARYDVRGESKTIDFANVYLVRTVDDHAVVFGWITGDEAAELRELGITG